MPVGRRKHEPTKDLTSETLTTTGHEIPLAASPPPGSVDVDTQSSPALLLIPQRRPQPGADTLQPPGRRAGGDQWKLDDSDEKAEQLKPRPVNWLSHLCAHYSITVRGRRSGVES